MAPQTSTRLTYEDYLELPDDGKQYELIEGELILNPAPVPRHQFIAVNIAGELRSYHLQYGVDECWLVDPDHDAFTLYRRSGTTFVLLETGGTITSPLLPGFALDVDDVFDV